MIVLPGLGAHLQQLAHFPVVDGHSPVFHHLRHCMRGNRRIDLENRQRPDCRSRKVAVVTGVEVEDCGSRTYWYAQFLHSGFFVLARSIVLGPLGGSPIKVLRVFD